MGTRSVIARGTALDNWRGRYCHWDGYPSGVGRDLFQLYQGHFQRDATAMLKALLDDHQGWSTIRGNWEKPAGFVTGTYAEIARVYGEKERYNSDLVHTHFGPQCYCHGERSEKLGWYDSSGGREEEYTYIINPETATMLMRLKKGVVEVDLNGPEPNWAAIEEKDDSCD